MPCAPTCRFTPKPAWNARVAAPLVSIIVPTRDRPALLPRAVGSLLAQTEKDTEVIVVDNSSPEVAKTFPEDLPNLRDPRVRVVPAPLAQNAGAARNAGLAVATGEWTTFLDDDDSYRPEKIGRQLARARASGSPLVLCGACYHLRGRSRVVHCDADRQEGDALLNRAALGTPFLFHRRQPDLRFAEELGAGEDLHYAHQLLARFDLRTVPVVSEPLVDVFQDEVARPRTNLRAEASWRAARRVWWEFGRRYSPSARRLYVLRARITREKLHGDARSVRQLLPALLWVGGPAEWRFAANAIAVGSGWGRGRWVT
jgi:glycosyltransferase involved in cell wall biosynthesis